MLHLIPAPLHWAAYRAAHRLRLIWWRLCKPRIRGCRILAFDAAGRVLLVRHSYGSSRWMLPAGGLRRAEDPVIGAVRELAEETGLRLEGARLVMTLEEPLSGATNEIHLVTGLTQGRLKADSREVIAAEFFTPSDWPEPMPVSHLQCLDEWVTAAATARLA